MEIVLPSIFSFKTDGNPCQRRHVATPMQKIVWQRGADMDFYQFWMEK
jgi:hypothetical protein